MQLLRKKNKLSTFFSEEQKLVNQEKILLVDYSNVLFRTLFVASYNNPDDEDFLYWKYLMINSIFNQARQFKPTQIYLVRDSLTNWRKSVYSEYKAHRKKARDSSVVDFKKFFPIADKFITEFKEVFTNFHIPIVDDCEADDIIAILSKDLSKKYKGSEITIISTDTDLNQLTNGKTIKQYDPIKKKFAKSINPKLQLETKILTGDKSDNVPGVCLRCGPKTASKMINEGLDIYMANEEIKKNYDRNKQLIDLDCIPINYVNDIRKHIAENETKPYDGYKVFNFLIKQKIAKMADDLQMYSPYLKDLK